MKTITEFLVEKLSKTKIFEMAHSRENYLRNVEGLTHQIVHNWCLIKYCNMFDEENYNRLHWSKELIAHIENLRIMKLKGSLNKLRVTQQSFIENSELDDENTIIDILEYKWFDEGLSKESMKTVAKEFTKALKTLCELIATNKSFDDVKEYVYNNI